MVNNFEVVKKIHEYMKSEIDLGEFRDWIVQTQIALEGTVDCVSVSDTQVKELLGEVEGRYAELVRGIVSVEEWKRRLEVLIVPKSGASRHLTSSFSTSTLNPIVVTGESGSDLDSTPTNSRQEIFAY